jgi:DNA end-binding protein Ku
VSEPLSEAAGCALLARLFRERGYTIRRNVVFREYGVSFHVDGWDAAARVGFEFLSSEKEDHDDLTLREFEKLKDAEARGELFLFIIDEVEPLSAAGLREAAAAFLDDVTRARRQAGRGATRRTAGPVKAPPKTKTASQSKTGTKAGGTSGRARPTAAKKPTAKKRATARAVQTAARTTGAAKPAAKKRPATQPPPTGTRRR